MVEIIEILNETSKNRTIFYCVVFLLAIEIITEGIVKIIQHFNKRKKKEERFND